MATTSEQSPPKVTTGHNPTDPNAQPGNYFLEEVSAQTGIDPRVVFAWMVQEGAFTKGGTGGFNYLNLRPYAGDRHISVSGGGFAQYASVQDAVKATVTNLHSPLYKNVLNTAHLKPSPKQQIAAIAASPWDANHYGGAGGPTLLKTFTKYFTTEGGGSAYQPPSTANIIETGSAETSIWDQMNTIADVFNGPFTWNSGINPIQDVFNAGDWVKNLFGWITGNWDRIFLVTAGAVGLAIAVILIAKSQSGGNTFTFSRGE